MDTSLVIPPSWHYEPFRAGLAVSLAPLWNQPSFQKHRCPSVGMDFRCHAGALGVLTHLGGITPGPSPRGTELGAVAAALGSGAHHDASAPASPERASLPWAARLLRSEEEPGAQRQRPQHPFARCYSTSSHAITNKRASGPFKVYVRLLPPEGACRALVLA